MIGQKYYSRANGLKSRDDLELGYFSRANGLKNREDVQIRQKHRDHGWEDVEVEKEE